MSLSSFSAEPCLRRCFVPHVPYPRKATYLRSKRGNKARLVHQNTTDRIELPENGVWGHIAYIALVKAGSSVSHLQRVYRDFCLSYKEQLPLWFDPVRKLWLFQPPSAMMERVFSVMNNMFVAQQTTILKDLFELTVMLRHSSDTRRDTRKDVPEPEPIA